MSRTIFKYDCKGGLAEYLLYFNDKSLNIFHLIKIISGVCKCRCPRTALTNSAGRQFHFVNAHAEATPVCENGLTLPSAHDLL